MIDRAVARRRPDSAIESVPPYAYFE